MSSEREPSLFVISAASGVGKSTVVARLLRELPGLRFSVSHTTRSPRPGEQDGVAYHFVTPEEFARIDAQAGFLEQAQVHGNRYGTSLAELDRARADGVDLLLDIDVQGAAQVRAKLPDVVMVLLFPPSYEVLERRLRGRGQDDDATVRRRLGAAQRELLHFREYDHVIVNDDLDTCVEEVKAVVRAARSRASRAGRLAHLILSGFPDASKETN